MSSSDVMGISELSVLGQRLSVVLGAARDSLELLEGESETLLEEARNLQDISAFAPVVTIVGQVKAGKTALTNAIARCPGLLPSNVNPWTSAVTAVHLNRPDQKNRSVFNFMSREDWDALRDGGGKLGELAHRAGIHDEAERLAEQVDALRDQAVKRLGVNFELLLGGRHSFDGFSSELIERYVCLADEDEGEGDKAGRYADITKVADIYISPQPKEMPLVIRDTPGVNDPFLVREHVTLRALRDTDICVLALSAGQALTMSDVGMLRILFALKPEQVIIFVNRIDELQAPETQMEEITGRIEETLSKLDIRLAPKIIFGSAAWANAAQTKDFDTLTPGSRRTLEKMAAAKNEAPEEAAWLLSGVPELTVEVARAAPKSTGGRVLNNAAQRIMSDLRQQAQLAEVELADVEKMLELDQLVEILDALIKESCASLEAEISRKSDVMKKRFLETIELFAKEEEQRLAEFLEAGGKGHWSVNSLRMRGVVSETYQQVMADHQENVEALFLATAKTLHDLIQKMIGSVKAPEVELPEIVDPGSPIAIAASLALDMNQSWWSRWVQREPQADRARKALGELIGGEAAVVLRQLESENLQPLASSERAALKSLLSDQCGVLCDLASRKEGMADKDYLAERIVALNDAASRLRTAVEVISDPQKHLKTAAE